MEKIEEGCKPVRGRAVISQTPLMKLAHYPQAIDE